MPSPITSRIKRHPSFGPLKSDKDKDPKAETFTEGKTEITKENVEGNKTDGKVVKASSNRCGTQAEKDAGKVTQTCEESGFSSLSDEEVKASEIKQGLRTEDTVTCPEGSTKDADGNCVKETKTTTPGSRGDVFTETESRVLQPWEIRRLNRSGRIADNRISSSSRRLTNLGGKQDADGNWSLDDNASAKDRRKFNKFKSKFERNTMQKTNVDRSVKSGRGAGELIHSGQRKTTQSEINKDPGSVKAQEKLNADRSAYDESQKAQQDAVTNSISSSSKPKSESIDPNQTNPFTAMLTKFEEDKQKGDYTFGKFDVGAGTSPKSSGLFAKKGAMKKGYFKGY
jgi:hypothetical protein